MRSSEGIESCHRFSMAMRRGSGTLEAVGAKGMLLVMRRIGVHGLRGRLWRSDQACSAASDST